MKRKAKVLIVEDELIIGKNIERYLGHLGYDVLDVCSSSEEALEIIHEEMPDLVLMDINIEGSEDGVSLADRLHREYQLPVVFLSALMDEETLERAKISQPFGYIVKPFSQRELHIALEIALYKADMEKRIKDQEVMLQALIDTMKQGFCLLDHQGRIVYANQELVRMLGHTEAQTVMSKNLDAMLWPPGLLQSHLQHQDPMSFDAQLPTGTGKSRNLIVTPQPIRHDDGTIRGAFVSLTATGGIGDD
jgi:PAS domain S-box-containing protein